MSISIKKTAQQQCASQTEAEDKDKRGQKQWTTRFDFYHQKCKRHAATALPLSKDASAPMNSWSDIGSMWWEPFVGCRVRRAVDESGGSIWKVAMIDGHDGSWTTQLDRWRDIMEILCMEEVIELVYLSALDILSICNPMMIFEHIQVYRSTRLNINRKSILN